MTRFMKLAIVAITLAALACSEGAGDGGIVDPPGTVVVSMPGNAFSPPNATIQVGGAIRWEFPSEAHDVVFVPMTGSPMNIPVTRNANVSRTFSTAGVFPYDCRVHPGMSGQITVTQ